MTTEIRTAHRGKTVAALVFGVMIAWVGLDLRASGIFRGLDAGYVYHPDESKQILALSRFLTDRYLWYTGNWHYDGYPYALNHLDENLIRAARAVDEKVWTALEPEYTAPEQHTRIELFFQARMLRVFYSMLAAACAVWAGALLLPQRRAVWWVAILAAIAPLSACVAHFGTGDVGTDLFAALALLFMAAHACRPRVVWLALSGAAVGIDFACKYNGLLTGLALALYVTLRALPKRQWRNFMLMCVVVGIAASMGVVLATPAMLLHWQRTWSDIFINFDKIQWYHVTPEWRAQPLYMRLLSSVRTNVPRVFGSLGWTVVAGVSISCVVLARSWRRYAFREPMPVDAESNRAAAQLAIAVFTLGALGISIIGKPVTQPFHFSFLVLPMLMGLTFGASALWESPSMAARLVATLLLLSALGELGWSARREHYFWSRDDAAAFRTYGRVVMGMKEGEAASACKYCELEDENMAEFRNEHMNKRPPQLINVPNGDAWRRIGVTPLPSVPYPDPIDWIFMNGAVFPRNDRMFRVPAGRSVDRDLVFRDEVKPVRLGIRSGAWPALVRVQGRGVDQTFSLTPNDEIIMDAPLTAARSVAGVAEHNKPVRLCPLSVRTITGDAWVTVLGSSREEAVYRAYGPHATTNDGMALAWTSERDGLGPMDFERLRFLESPPGETVMMTAKTNQSDGRILSPGGAIPFFFINHKVQPVLARGDASDMKEDRTVGEIPLPAGAYCAECDLVVATNDTDLDWHMDDTCGLGGFEPSSQHETLGVGEHHITFHFVKPFAPYEVFLTLNCTRGRCVMTGWRLHPDIERTWAELKTWSDGSHPPAWLSPPSTTNDPTWKHVHAGLSFANRLAVDDISFTPVLTSDQPLQLQWSMRLTHDMPDYGDLDIFVHLDGPHGAMPLNAGYTLFEGFAANAAGRPMSLNTAPLLSSGDYTLKVGIWNRMMLKRVPLKASPEASVQAHADEYTVGVVHVEGPAQ